jgi:hypothetical protein
MYSVPASSVASHCCSSLVAWSAHSGEFSLSSPGTENPVTSNGSACNVGTGHESAKMPARVPASNFSANWEVGNGYWLGEVSYPDGYDTL